MTATYIINKQKRLYQFDYNCLDTLIKIDGPMNIDDFVAYSGYAKSSTWKGLCYLVALGMASRIYHGTYVITERGRIAHALHTVWIRRKSRNKIRMKTRIAEVERVYLGAA